MVNDWSSGGRGIMTLQAKLLEIDGRRIEGLKLRDALREAYDTIAQDMPREERNEEALSSRIPELVFAEALRMGWIQRPPEPQPQRIIYVAHGGRKPWLPTTKGWLSRYVEKTDPPRPTFEIKDVAKVNVAGIEVPESWWNNVWLPIFAGRIQVWRARLMSAHPSKPDRKKTFLRRAEWLRARLLERGWGERELADHAAVDEKTVRRILRGLPVTHKSLAAIVDGLNRHSRSLKVSAEMVPGD